MPIPLVTLTTDFGGGSAYVAAMTGSLLRVCPAAHIFDLCHDIPPHDIAAASRFLATALPYWPAGTVHVVVVDPGVGSSRRLLMADWPAGTILAPDNGCWSALPAVWGRPVVRGLTEPAYWNAAVSPTFHGRDILAPVAGHRLNGVAAAAFGPEVGDWVVLNDDAAGRVAVVDRFGNLVTNVRLEKSLSMTRLSVRIDKSELSLPAVRTYADAAKGELVALTSSDGYLEIAVVEGSAAARLGAAVGSAVAVIPTADPIAKLTECVTS